MVRQRRTRIGVRMAFGATQGSYRSLIIGPAWRLSPLAIAAGNRGGIAHPRHW